MWAGHFTFLFILELCHNFSLGGLSRLRFAFVYFTPFIYNLDSNLVFIYQPTNSPSCFYLLIHIHTQSFILGHVDSTIALTWWSSLVCVTTWVHFKTCVWYISYRAQIMGFQRLQTWQFLLQKFEFCLTCEII